MPFPLLMPLCCSSEFSLPLTCSCCLSLLLAHIASLLLCRAQYHPFPFSPDVVCVQSPETIPGGDTPTFRKPEVLPDRASSGFGVKLNLSRSLPTCDSFLCLHTHSPTINHSVILTLLLLIMLDQYMLSQEKHAPF